MKLTVEFEYAQAWQLSKDHSPVRVYYPHSVLDVEIEEPKEDMFPLVAQIFKRNADGLWASTGDIRYYKEKFWIETSILVNELHNKIKCFPYHVLGEMNPTMVNDKDIVFLENTKEEIAEKIRFKASDFLVFNDKVWQESREPVYKVSVHGDKLALSIVYADTILPGEFSALEKEEAIRFGEELYCRQHGTLQELAYDISEDINVYAPQYLKRYPRAVKEEDAKETQSRQNWMCEMSYLFGYYMAKGMLRDSSVLCSLSNFIKEVDNWVAEYEGEMLEHDSIDEFLDGKLVELGWKE